MRVDVRGRKGQLLRAAWEAFASNALPVRLPPADRRRAELTFYAGGSAVLDIVSRLSEPDIGEDEGVEILESLHVERRAFAARMLQLPDLRTRDS